MKMNLMLFAGLQCLAILFACTGAFSQTNDILLRSELENAKTDLADEQFRSAIRHLDEAKRLLKETTPEIQSLLVKSYVGLEYFDDARRELELYFQIASETSPNYTEMVRLVGKMSDLETRQVREEADIKKAKEEEEQLWAQVKLEKSTASVNQYLEKYPAGAHSMAARNYLIMQKEFQTEKTLGDQYKARWQKRKKSRTAWLITGLVLTGAGAILYASNKDYYDDYYDTTYGWSYEYNETKETLYYVGIGSAGAGSICLWTAALTSSKKFKKKYYQQLDKLQVLENQMGDALR